MHELSIAQNILEIVRQSVGQEELQNVRKVRLKIGVLSGVVADSLDFCFSAIAKDTELAGASLAIDILPFRVRCESCNHESENEIGVVVCPSCGSSRTIVLTGRELQVVDVELEENERGPA